MTYSHSSNHSFKPNIEFWKAIENLFRNFPYWEQSSILSKFDKTQLNRLTRYYEKRTFETFEINESGGDVYGYAFRQRKSGYNSIYKKKDYLGMLIKFLSDCISNPNLVHKFKHFFESMYYNLSERNAGIQLIDYENYFNNACRKHGVPFVMFTQNNECYVVHITDIFVEKAILDTPVFLKNNNLKQANEYFVKAITWRDKGDYKESLNNLRQAMEDIRDEIYKRYNLGNRSISLHNDLMKLFNQHKDIVFDFLKIPQSDPKELEKIITKLKESVSLVVKMTNIGAHKSSVPTLIEENTTLIALGLVATIFPYIFYLLK